MRDVAKRAGVSITTVSHVLNETRPVAKTTCARVLKAAASLHYYKNTSARLLVRGQSDLVGLIISDIENPFFPELIKSFEKACAAERMEMLLAATNYDPAQEKMAVRRMLENRVRGVAVMTSQFDPVLEELLASRKVPVVRLGSGSAGDYRSNIAFNYRQGLREALQHLAGFGHSEIAVATGPLNQVSAREYKKAALRMMQQLGLKPFSVTEGDHQPESGARLAKELLQCRPRPTAILCGNDRMAIGAVGTLESMGFSVPGDVSVVGADDIWMARYCHPPLTTVRLPRDVLGEMAFKVLEEMLRSGRKPGTEHSLDTHLVVRCSSGGAPGRPLTRSPRRVVGRA